MGKHVRIISQSHIWGVDILMIFVTLGTQDKPFKRLLKAIDAEISKGNIKEKVIVQAGTTNYHSDYMEIFDLVEKDKFDDYIKTCDILITHGGVGSILTGIKHKKVVIACPRLSKYKEHLNNHQLQIVEKFSHDGYILAYNEKDDLGNVLKEARKFKPKEYISNNKNIIELIANFIENN